MTLFGNQVTADVVSYDEVLREGLAQYDCCRHKKGKFGHRHSHTETTLCEHEGRGQGDAKGMPKIASNHRTPGERPGTDSPSQPLKVPTLLTLISDFQPLGLWDDGPLRFKPPSVRHLATAALAS